MTVPGPQTGWRTALVTGASSGIGHAFATRLARDGTHLVVTARRADRLETLAAELRASNGIEVEVLEADLLEPAGRRRVAERLTDPERPIDLLVNNAGAGAAGAFADGELDRYLRIVDLNVTAVVELAHAAAGAMRDRRRGWILNVSSLGGHAPGPGFAVYSATKAFVTSFSEALHEELRSAGIVVTVVCPGATVSEFAEVAGAEQGDALPDFIVQTADQVADEAIAALAAGRAVRVTGTVNRITGALSTVMPRTVNRKIAGIIASRVGGDTA